MDWLIATKLAPPLSNRHTLARSGLLERLGKGPLPRLIMLNASAGYGKTSLLIQIRAYLLDSGAKVGWLSLDDGDADPQVFLAYMIAALNQAGVNLQGLTDAAATGESAETVRRNVSTLLNRCAEEQGQVAIILDDYNRIGGTPSEQLLRSLLERLPPNLHLVISTRELPKLPLASLRASEELVEFSMADLKMNFEEAQRLLTAGQTADVSEGDVALVLKRTEGWPIALQMARSWLDRRGQQAAVIKSFSGRLADLAGYLSEQVLLALPEDLQTVLMRMALVEQVCGDILNELCGRSDGGVLLEKFEAQNLLLSRLDEEGNWYRLHPLFSEFLVERLRRADAAAIPRLYEKAALWFEQRGLLAEALRLAWASGSSMLAAKLLDKSGGWRLFLDGRIAILRSTTNKLSDQELLRFPRLALSRTILLGKSGHPDEANAWFERVRHLTGDFTDPLESAPDEAAIAPLAIEAGFVRLMPSLYQDTVLAPETLALIKGMMSSLPAGDALLNAICENSLCMHHFDNCAYAEALAAGERAAGIYRKTGAVFGELDIELLEGSIYFAQGRLRDAELLLAETHKKALASFGEDAEITSLAEVYLAELLYQWDRVEEASAMLERALPIVEQYDAWHSVLLSGYVTLSNVRRRLLGASQGLQAIEQGLAQAVRRKMTRLQMALRLQQILDLLRNDALTEARELAQALDLETVARGGRTPGQLTPRDCQVACMVLARLDLAAGDPDRALERLTPLIAELSRLGSGRHLVDARILRARAHFERGAVEEALEDFDRAVSMAMFEGMQRVFIDEAPAIGPLLDAAVQAAGGRGANGLKARFLSGVLEKTRKESRQVARNTRPRGLSDRELEILTFLDRGYSNKHVAREIDVSESTVKFHLRNLFAKLGVHTREEAVQVFRQEFGIH